MIVGGGTVIVVGGIVIVGGGTVIVVGRTGHGVEVSVDNLLSGSMSNSTPLRQTVTGSLIASKMFTCLFTCWAIVV